MYGSSSGQISIRNTLGEVRNRKKKKRTASPLFSMDVADCCRKKDGETTINNGKKKKIFCMQQCYKISRIFQSVWGKKRLLKKRKRPSDSKTLHF